MRLSAGLLVIYCAIASIARAQSVCSSGQRWAVAARPILSIGEVEGAPEYLFSRISNAYMLADSSIVIANANPPSLRYYNPQGRFLRAVGRRGSGPGEFQSLVSFVRGPSDSLVTFDIIGRRVSVFAPQGKYVRILQPDPEIMRGLLRVHFIGGSQIVLIGSLPLRVGIGRDSLVVFMHDFVTNRTSRLGTFAGMDSHTEPGQTARGIRIHIVPFTRGLASAAGSGHLFLADTERDRIQVYNSKGQLLRTFGSGRKGEPLTAQDRKDYSRRDSVAAFPANKPFLGEFVVDAQGNLWAERYQAAQEHKARIWDIYTPSGARVCAAVTPADHKILEIGRTYILARAIDDLGVERVVKLVLPRS